MIKKSVAPIVVSALLFSYAAFSAHGAGVTVYDEGEKSVKIGGRIQLQYHHTDPSDGESTDKVFLRRLRPYIMGTIHEDWMGKIQWDMGKADDENEMAIKDAYFQYTGFNNLKVWMGNLYFPFSREDLTSSKKQQLVERTFVGDHSYGSPERNACLRLSGHNDDKIVTYDLAVAAASIDPDENKLDFDTPVNRNDDFNQGWMYGGRAEVYPFGYFKMAQGDFSRELKAAVGVAGYGWNNDDDNNTYTGLTNGVLTSTSSSKADIDRVIGFEVSGALRFVGISIDVEYNRFEVDAVDAAFTGGILKNGSTTLDNYAAEGGYMLIPGKLELVAGYQAQDSDNYGKVWTRKSVGANWFIHKQDIKAQFTYRFGENLNGVDNDDEDEIFVQTQYVF